MEFLGSVNANLVESMNIIMVSMPHLGLTVSDQAAAKVRIIKANTSSLLSESEGSEGGRSDFSKGLEW